MHSFISRSSARGGAAAGFMPLPAAGFMLLLALSGATQAQPFAAWSVFSGTGSASAGNGDLGIPDAPALNPTAEITVEAWVSLLVPFPGEPCRSLVGKGYLLAWWIGACSQADGTTVLRSSTRGSGSQADGGIIPSGEWTHIAVTSDGATRRHYVNGELVGTFAESGPPAASGAPLEIGGDMAWAYSPSGALNEVRLWNVARTVDEIRATLNVHLGSPQPGLVAVWGMGDGGDSLGHYPGTFAGTHAVQTSAVAVSCGGSTAFDLCLEGRFAVDARFRVGAPGTAEGTAMTAGCANPGSGLFWFFDPGNWEVMVKVVDACVLNHQWWVFSAATTNVFYRLEVTDVRTGNAKIYFNYPGPPAPAVTDTVALPCP